MSSTREQILAATCELLEAQGYHATGLNQILATSGTPKGSLYYYFPGGKEELAAEAVARIASMVSRRIRSELSGSAPASEAIPAFVNFIAQRVEASAFRGGGPLTIIAMETANASERLNRACREAYRQLQEAFEEKLLASGYPAGRASDLAIFIVSLIEGATILSRTEHSGKPLRQVAQELAFLLKACDAHNS